MIYAILALVALIALAVVHYFPTIHAKIDSILTSIGLLHSAALASATVTGVTTLYGGAPTAASIAAQLAAVPPVPLDPTQAVSMSQTQVENLGYVNYLTAPGFNLSAWQSAYVTAAAALSATGTLPGGMLVWCPSQNKPLTISSAAWANLAQLRALGVTGIVTGSAVGQ